jgi:Phage-related tail fibre protein
MAGKITVHETEKEYESIVTDVGNALMMNAVKNGTKVIITDFAVGDGNGEYYRPETGMTELKNELWRGKINSCEICRDSPNILIVTAVCPGTVGGFTIREIAVFDQDNHMIAVGNTPDTPKVTVIDGVVNELRLMMEIALINGDSVELLIDPYIVTATKKDVEEVWAKIRENGKVTVGTAETPYEANEIRFIVSELPY